jgi:uncharacterized protein YcsI (UPF0317 family)
VSQPLCETSGAPLSGAEIRQLCRSRKLTGPTAHVGRGLLQANLVVLPVRYADDFHAFCRKNAQPLPLLEMTQPGSSQLTQLASDADLRTDLPRYRVYRDGQIVDEPTDVSNYWRPDLVSFLLGCSFTFDHLLCKAGIPVRHIEEAKNVSMYRTNRRCDPAGVFHADLVVSMRPIRSDFVEKAISLTAQNPLAHGAPVHVGDPKAIGIADLARPDFGDPVMIHPNEQPVFWACGVTSHVAILESRPDFAITHSPGCMFVSDRPAEG